MCKIKHTHIHSNPLSSTADASQSQMRSGRWPSPQLNTQGGLICQSPLEAISKNPTAAR